MNRFSVDVLLRFPAMDDAYRVEVSLPQLLFLDRHGDRGFAEDGTVVYQMSPARRAELIQRLYYPDDKTDA